MSSPAPVALAPPAGVQEKPEPTCGTSPTRPASANHRPAVEVAAANRPRWRGGVREPLAGPFRHQVDAGFDAEVGREFGRVFADDADVGRLRGDDACGSDGRLDAGDVRDGADGPVARHQPCVDANDAVGLDGAAAAGVEPLVTLQPTERRLDGVEGGVRGRPVARGGVEDGLPVGRRSAEARARPRTAVDDDAHTDR